ncbi:MAG: hypothetical protein N3A61_04150, partial [Ignavibacteria bacterium]|nr:hypothetical protein [Ignavibacteria bacterium]
MIEKAKAHIQNLIRILNSTKLEVGEITNENYSYAVEVKSNKEKVKILVYNGKKGMKTVLQGNTNSELYKNVYQVVFGQTLPFQEQEISEPEDYIGV